jgi:hypothetical protein
VTTPSSAPSFASVYASTSAAVHGPGRHHVRG